MMKRLFFACLCFAIATLSFSQNAKPASSEKFDYVIGLPKMTFVQLEFIKTDLLQFSQLVSAEFVFKDHCLLIETDDEAPKPLQYSAIEKVLRAYFKQEDIFPKIVGSFSDFKSENQKNDKFIIK